VPVGSVGSVAHIRLAEAALAPAVRGAISEALGAKLRCVVVPAQPRDDGRGAWAILIVAHVYSGGDLHAHGAALNHSGVLTEVAEARLPYVTLPAL